MAKKSKTGARGKSRGGTPIVVIGLSNEDVEALDRVGKLYGHPHRSQALRFAVGQQWLRDRAYGCDKFPDGDGVVRLSDLPGAVMPAGKYRDIVDVTLKGIITLEYRNLSRQDRMKHPVFNHSRGVADRRFAVKMTPDDVSKMAAIGDDWSIPKRMGVIRFAIRVQDAIDAYWSNRTEGN